MSHPAISAIPRVYDAGWQGNSAVKLPIDRKPIGTCLKGMIQRYDHDELKTLVHSIRLRCQCVTLSAACSEICGRSSKSGCQSSSEVNGRAKGV